MTMHQSKTGRVRGVIPFVSLIEEAEAIEAKIAAWRTRLECITGQSKRARRRLQGMIQDGLRMVCRIRAGAVINTFHKNNSQLHRP